MEVYDFPEIYQILIYLIPYVGIRALLTLPFFNCMGGGLRLSRNSQDISIYYKLLHACFLIYKEPATGGSKYFVLIF